jgi:hypothetical protein
MANLVSRHSDLAGDFYSNLATAETNARSFAVEITKREAKQSHSNASRYFRTSDQKVGLLTLGRNGLPCSLVGMKLPSFCLESIQFQWEAARERATSVWTNRIGERGFLELFVAAHCTKAYTPAKSPDGGFGGSVMNYPETSYLWQNAYMAAVCETDNGLMMIRIYEALAAIEQRRLTPVEPGSEEERALEAAETGLRSLITERTEECA